MDIGNGGGRLRSARGGQQRDRAGRADRQLTPSSQKAPPYTGMESPLRRIAKPATNSRQSHQKGDAALLIPVRPRQRRRARRLLRLSSARRGSHGIGDLDRLGRKLDLHRQGARARLLLPVGHDRSRQPERQRQWRRDGIRLERRRRQRPRTPDRARQLANPFKVHDQLDCMMVSVPERQA